MTRQNGETTSTVFMVCHSFLRNSTYCDEKLNAKELIMPTAKGLVKHAVTRFNSASLSYNTIQRHITKTSA